MHASTSARCVSSSLCAVGLLTLPPTSTSAPRTVPLAQLDPTHSTGSIIACHSTYSSHQRRTQTRGRTRHARPRFDLTRKSVLPFRSSLSNRFFLPQRSDLRPSYLLLRRSGGIILWQKSYTPSAAQLAASPSSPLNALVRDVFIEGKPVVAAVNTGPVGVQTEQGRDVWESGGWKMEWGRENGLGLIFVVGSRRSLPFKPVPRRSSDALLSFPRSPTIDFFSFPTSRCSSHR